MDGDTQPSRRWARWWSALFEARVPEPWPGGAWRCPRCGRPLVGEGRPGRNGFLRWEGMSREQQVADCLVDGSKLAAERRAALENIDVDAAIRDEIRRLDAAGETKWVERLATANHGTDRLFDVAHYLSWLRRDPSVAVDRQAVDELLYAIGCRFPAPGPRPPGAPMVFGHPL